MAEMIMTADDSNKKDMAVAAMMGTLAAEEVVVTEEAKTTDMEATKDTLVAVDMTNDHLEAAMVEVATLVAAATTMMTKSCSKHKDTIPVGAATSSPQPSLS